MPFRFQGILVLFYFCLGSFIVSIPHLLLSIFAVEFSVQAYPFLKIPRRRSYLEFDVFLRELVVYVTIYRRAGEDVSILRQPFQLATITRASPHPHPHKSRACHFAGIQRVHQRFVC